MVYISADGTVGGRKSLKVVGTSFVMGIINAIYLFFTSICSSRTTTTTTTGGVFRTKGARPGFANAPGAKSGAGTALADHGSKKCTCGKPGCGGQNIRTVGDFRSAGAACAAGG